MVNKITSALLVCVVGLVGAAAATADTDSATADTAATAAATTARAETFLIPAGNPGGREATIKIPVGAITGLSADFAQPLSNDADPQVEAMRLTGDVFINVAGSNEPIEIKADRLVLELIPDGDRDPPRRSRSASAAHQLRRSTTTLPGGDEFQVFIGNVVFDLDTAAGPMEIQAERVEHRLPDASRP
jgi:hypothetical protein